MAVKENLIYKVLLKHQRTLGMKVSMGYTCACGFYTTGATGAGTDPIMMHRAQMIAEAINASN